MKKSLLILSLLFSGCSLIPWFMGSNQPKIETVQSVTRYNDSVSTSSNESYFADLKKLVDSTNSFSIPILRIFNSKGELIYRKNGYNPNLKEKILLAFKENKSLDDSIGFQNEILMIDQKRKKLIDISIEKYDFVIVEYWAIWCGPCKTQMKEIEELIKSKSELSFRYIKLNCDYMETKK